MSTSRDDKERSGARLIIEPGGEVREYHARRTTGVVYNGKWWRNIFQLNMEFSKILATYIGSMLLIGGAMAGAGKWLFADKIKSEVKSVIREEVKSIAEESETTRLTLERHLLEAKIAEITYTTDAELEARLHEIIERIRVLEDRQYANRRDIERIERR